MTRQSAIKTKLILIEDEPGHTRLITKNLRKSADVEILPFDTGRKALEYFDGKAPEDLCRHLVVLDINMPGIDGFEVLRRLKGNETTAPIPVIVFTTTDNPDEIRRCYREGANLYLVKPMDYTAFQATIDFLAACLTMMRFP
uniref:Response regulator n=1 Tax=Geobacter metallireducens TaxID=28232 RepID=A0A831UBQ4_GEOME